MNVHSFQGEIAQFARQKATRYGISLWNAILSLLIHTYPKHHPNVGKYMAVGKTLAPFTPE